MEITACEFWKLSLRHAPGLSENCRHRSNRPDLPAPICRPRSTHPGLQTPVYKPWSPEASILPAFRSTSLVISSCVRRVEMQIGYALAVALVAVVSPLASYGASPALHVKIDTGTLDGKTSGSVRAFLGIPY